jgi:hypothetical protein
MKKTKFASILETHRVDIIMGMASLILPSDYDLQSEKTREQINNDYETIIGELEQMTQSELMAKATELGLITR